MASAKGPNQSGGSLVIPMNKADQAQHASQPATAPPATAANGSEPKLSRASVGRFSLYLRHLQRFLREGVQTVSSSQLGEALGITDAQVRKDLACLGNLGHPGVGYTASELIAALRHR